MQAPGQQQGYRKSARIIDESIGLELVWQGSGQGIKEGRITKAFELAAAVGRSTPNQLKQAIAQGQHRERPLRPQQLPSLVVGTTAQLHQGREAVLAVGPLQHPDTKSLPAGGVGAIGRHDKVERRLITCAERRP